MTASDAEIASALLAFARETIGDAAVDFADPPAPISGGFDTRIFAFRLRGAPPALADPLILRILAPHHDPARALREGIVQNTIAGLGYPSPRVPWASSDTRRFGGAFLVMERMRGRPLLDARRLDLAGTLARAQARLHALPADPLLAALDAATPPIPHTAITFDGYLAQLGARIAKGGHTGLEPTMRWLRTHAPPASGSPVVCHGDFHPHNVLYERGVTAVLDWPNALIADRGYDVAATKTILGLAPIDIVKLSPIKQWLITTLRPLMVKRYLAVYRQHHKIEPRTLEYFEVASAMRALVRAAEDRTRPSEAGQNALAESNFPELLRERVREITGLEVGLPPKPS